MNLNFFKSHSLENTTAKNANFMQSFINELQNFLHSPKNHPILKKDLYTVDRFEGAFAVCENKRTLEMFSIPKLELPSNIEEGSILKVQNNAYVLDEGETTKARKEMQDLQKKIFK